MKSLIWRWLEPFRRWPRWLLTVVTVSAVLYLTLFPRPLPDNDFRFWEHTDKIVHALMMLGVYTAIAIDLRRPLTAKLRWSLFAAVAAFGALIELAQQSMGLGRTGSAADLIADLIGTLLPTLLL
ncbi:MAG: hypothetical protein K2K82_08530 [Muribaculaceae bacterium]|nr:hypothetical protein [Muribaculaceae bacterium]